MTSYIFELPIYRCSEQQFESQYTKAWQSHLASLEKRSGGVTWEQAPITYQSAESEFRDSYGGPWRYNQVIAWLRLCAGRSSICADLWLWNAKRFRRKPREKQLLFIGTEVIAQCGPQNTSPQIFAEVCRCFDTYEVAWRRRGYALERGCFMRLGPFVDWRRVLDHASSIHSPMWLEDFEGTPLALNV